jgi:hypothetical protein
MTPHSKQVTIVFNDQKIVIPKINAFWIQSFKDYSIVYVQLEGAKPFSIYVYKGHYSHVTEAELIADKIECALIQFYNDNSTNETRA